MKKKDLDKFKAILEDKKQKILGHLEGISRDSEKSLEESPTGDQADLASLEINQTNLAKIGKREMQLLKKIDLALKKIEDKTYGECESCGEEISVARLEIRPEAQLCIDCKTEQENVERRFSDKVEASDEDGEFFEEGDEE